MIRQLQLHGFHNEKAVLLFQSRTVVKDPLPMPLIPHFRIMLHIREKAVSKRGLDVMCCASRN